MISKQYDLNTDGYQSNQSLFSHSKQYDQIFVGNVKEIPANIKILLVKVDINGEVIDDYTQYGWTKQELIQFFGVLNFKGIEYYDLKEVQLRLIPLYPGEELDKKMEIKFQALLTFSYDQNQHCPQVICMHNFRQFLGNDGLQIIQQLYYIDPFVIGKGGQGVVNKATNKETGKQYAIKIMEIQDIIKNNTQEINVEQAKAKIHNEILLQRKVKSPNIIEIHEHLFTDEKIFIVMELGKQNLQKYISTRTTALSELELCKFMSQIVKAVQITHKNGIMHRDLKPLNLIFCNDDVIKLIDFGFARAAIQASTVSGTESYIAPEIVAYQVNVNQLQQKYTNAVDIFSLGCILYFLMTFENAFKTNGEVISSDPEQVEVGKYDPEICAMCFRMLSKNPKQRSSIDEVVQLFEDLTQQIEIKYEPHPLMNKAGYDKFMRDSEIIKQLLQPLINSLAQRAENENKAKPIEKQMDPIIFKDLCEIKILNLVYFGNDIKVIKSEIKYLFNNFSFTNLIDGIHYGEINTDRQLEFQKVVCNKEHKTKSEGTELFGPFNKDGMSGFCRIVCKKGDKYFGECINNKLDGFVVCKYAKKCDYKGNWVNGKQNGKGVYIYANRDVYDGDWVNGKQNGFGIYKYNCGSIYEGNYDNGQRSGQGVYKHANGRIDEGEFKNGKLNGKATIKYENGDVYEGYCKDNMRDGQGKLLKKDGKVMEGIWINDELKK